MEIHQTKRFAKQLSALAKAGKNERDAAGRAQDILARLQHDPQDSAAENKRTRHGELRVANCRKYDLSCGIRLIAIRRNTRLIFVFIGSHDQSRIWLNNNRHVLEELDSEPVPHFHWHPKDPAPQSGIDHHYDEYEEELMARIDQAMLREIFPFAS